MLYQISLLFLSLTWGGADCLLSTPQALHNSRSRGRELRAFKFDFPWNTPSASSAAAVQESKANLVSLSRRAPKNGVGASDETKAQIEAAATTLERMCPPKPARKELQGVYDLLYCTAPGGSNGKVGPFVGQVTQEFLNAVDFINAVELFGLVKVSLYAEREVLDDKRIRVTFKQTGVQVMGQELFRKDINGSGVWVQRFVDDDLRVMNTPSLFVLKKRAGNNDT